MDIGSGAWKMDEFKSELWEKTSIGIPHLDVETNDAVIFGKSIEILYTGDNYCFNLAS